MPQIERRSYVRGNFSFKIKFKTMTSEEYEATLNSFEPIYTRYSEKSGIDAAGKTDSPDTSIDASLMDYMARIDEKLNLILELLTIDEEEESLFEQGLATWEMTCENDFKRHSAHHGCEISQAGSRRLSQSLSSYV